MKKIFYTLVLALLFSPLPLNAADKKFCENYATEAVSQFKLNNRSSCGYSGSRWNANYVGQFDWCLTVRQAIPESENRIRADMLLECIGENVMNHQQIKLDEQADNTVENPPLMVTFLINRYAPKLFDWLYMLEKEYAPQGRPLTEIETKVAKQIGVHNPENIRVVVIDAIPLPEPSDVGSIVSKLVKKMGKEVARPVGYTIFFIPSYENNREMFSANLKAVQLIEEQGRKGFLKRYMIELFINGETEANRLSYIAGEQYGDSAYQE